MHFVHVWILDVKTKTYISNLELTQVTICINLSGFCMLNYRHDFEIFTYLEHCLEWYKNKPQIWFCRSLNFLYIIKIAIRAVVWWLDLNLMQSLPFAAKQFFFYASQWRGAIYEACQRLFHVSSGYTGFIFQWNRPPRKIVLNTNNPNTLTTTNGSENPNNSNKSSDIVFSLYG